MKITKEDEKLAKEMMDKLTGNFIEKITKVLDEIIKEDALIYTEDFYGNYIHGQVKKICNDNNEEFEYGYDKREVVLYCGSYEIELDLEECDPENTTDISNVSGLWDTASADDFDSEEEYEEHLKNMVKEFSHLRSYKIA